MANTQMSKQFAAGIYEQSDDGWRPVEWSRHARADLALEAARRYRRRLQRDVSAGGAKSWSVWTSGPDGRAVEVGS